MCPGLFGEDLSLHLTLKFTPNYVVFGFQASFPSVMYGFIRAELYVVCCSILNRWALFWCQPAERFYTSTWEPSQLESE